MTPLTIRSDLFSVCAEENSLSSFQLSCSQAFQGFKGEACNPVTLLGLIAGGALARTVELGCFKSFASISRPYLSLFVSKLSSLTGIITEGSVFAALPMIQQGGSLSSWSIGTGHGSLVIGLSRVVARYTHGSFLVSCLSQDCVVMGVDISFEKLSLRESEKIGLGERWVHARAIAFQMQVSGELCHFIPVSMHHKARFEVEKGVDESSFMSGISNHNVSSPFSLFFGQSLVTPEGILFSENATEKIRATELSKSADHVSLEGDRLSEVCNILEKDSKKAGTGTKKKSKLQKRILENETLDEQKRKFTLQEMTNEMMRIAYDSYSVELREAYALQKKNKRNRVVSETDTENWRRLRKLWEIEQAQKIKKGTRFERERAKLALIGSLTRFIYRKTIKLFPSEGIPLKEINAVRDEFVKQVLDILFRYIDKFNPEAKNSALYITYGGKAILMAFSRFGRPISSDIPMKILTVKNSLTQKIKDAQKALTQEVNGEIIRPTSAEIAKKIRKNPGTVAQVLNLMTYSNVLHLDAPVDGEDSLFLREVLPAEDAYNPELAIGRKQMHQQLLQLYNHFAATLVSPIEITIFKERLLSSELDPPTLETIAIRYGLSRERARQKEQQLLTRLRKYLIACGIESVFG